MSERESSKSWGFTILIGVIILSLVIIAVIIIYYVFTLPQQIPFPVSPFNYGDIIQICPAVFSQEEFNINNTDQNQYLTSVAPGSSCQHPNDGYAQSGTCIASFTGNKMDKASKWILQNAYDSTADCGPPEKCFNTSRCSTCPNMLSQQNFLKFGNRFYLQNAMATSPSDTTALLTYWSPVNSNIYSPSWDTSVTFPLTGNTSIPNYPEQRYDQPMVVYFLPTTQQDIYYILYPTQNWLYDDIIIDTYPNSLSPNDGIMSLRPFAQPNNYYYFPWEGNNINPNGLLLNDLSDKFVSIDTTAVGTNRPNIFLYKITTAPK